jgi:hypothetical protein
MEFLAETISGRPKSPYATAFRTEGTRRLRPEKK